MPSGSQQGPHAAHNAVPTAHSQQPTTDDETEVLDEEELRQERTRLDTYYLADRRQSGELHGIYYTSAPEVSSPTKQPDSISMAQQMNNNSTAGGIPLPMSQGANAGRLGSCPEDASLPTPADAGDIAAVHDLEQQQKDNGQENKVLELLAPISEATTGHPPLTLGFNRLSVWAPVNPKKAGWAERAWKKCISRGKAVTNPKRQILYSLSGQVRYILNHLWHL